MTDASRAATISFFARLVEMANRTARWRPADRRPPSVCHGCSSSLAAAFTADEAAAGPALLLHSSVPFGVARAGEDESAVLETMLSDLNKAAACPRDGCGK